MGLWNKTVKKAGQAFDATTAYLEDSQRDTEFESEVKGVLADGKRKLHALVGGAAELGAQGANAVGADEVADQLSSVAKNQKIKAEPSMMKRLMLQIKKLMEDLVKSIKNVCKKHGVESEKFTEPFEDVAQEAGKGAKENKQETTQHRERAQKIAAMREKYGIEK